MKGRKQSSRGDTYRHSNKKAAKIVMIWRLSVFYNCVGATALALLHLLIHQLIFVAAIRPPDFWKPQNLDSASRLKLQRTG